MTKGGGTPASLSGWLSPGHREYDKARFFLDTLLLGTEGPCLSSRLFPLVLCGLLRALAQRSQASGKTVSHQQRPWAPRAALVPSASVEPETQTRLQTRGHCVWELRPLAWGPGGGGRTQLFSGQLSSLGEAAVQRRQACQPPTAPPPTRGMRLLRDCCGHGRIPQSRLSAGWERRNPGAGDVGPGLEVSGFWRGSHGMGRADFQHSGFHRHSGRSFLFTDQLAPGPQVLGFLLPSLFLSPLRNPCA